MGTRGTQRSLCCHPLFSAGALWCPSTHIRYGRPGAKEPHAERPSPPSPHFCSLPSPGYSVLCSSQLAFLLLQACCAFFPTSAASISCPSHHPPGTPWPAASTVGVPSRDLQQCHLPVADLLTQLGGVGSATVSRAPWCQPGLDAANTSTIPAA